MYNVTIILYKYFKENNIDLKKFPEKDFEISGRTRCFIFFAGRASSDGILRLPGYNKCCEKLKVRS